MEEVKTWDIRPSMEAVQVYWPPAKPMVKRELFMLPSTIDLACLYELFHFTCPLQLLLDTCR
jgi:hypothetical protein